MYCAPKIERVRGSTHARPWEYLDRKERCKSSGFWQELDLTDGRVVKAVEI